MKTLEELFQTAVVLTTGSSDSVERQAYVRAMCRVFATADLAGVERAVGKCLMEKSFRPTIADINKFLKEEDRPDDWERQAEIARSMRERSRQELLEWEQSKDARLSIADRLARLKVFRAGMAPAGVPADHGHPVMVKWVYEGIVDESATLYKTGRAVYEIEKAPRRI